MLMNNNVRESFTDSVYSVGKKNKKLCVVVSDISHFRLQKFAKENTYKIRTKKMIKKIDFLN